MPCWCCIICMRAGSIPEIHIDYINHIPRSRVNGNYFFLHPCMMGWSTNANFFKISFSLILKDVKDLECICWCSEEKKVSKTHRYWIYSFNLTCPKSNINDWLSAVRSRLQQESFSVKSDFYYSLKLTNPLLLLLLWSERDHTHN